MHISFVRSRQSSSSPRNSRLPSFIPSIVQRFSSSTDDSITSRKAKQDKPFNAVDLSALDDINIIFVLGGPGSGKGTVSESLAQVYNMKHVSAGGYSCINS
jgi:ABC-type polysaccharide/polyol phosphate transport system ATPase subunit